MKGKRLLIWVGAGLFAALFLFSGYQLLNWYGDIARAQRELGQVEELLGGDVEASGIFGSADDSAEPPILEEYRAAYAANSDFAGWIAIEGTRIDYPVMQSREEPDFYLKHNFEKQDSSSGVPYLQADCELLSSDNLIIYGHSVKDGSMFSNLKKYRSEKFYREHRLIRFDSRYSHGTYEVVAAFSTTVNDGGFLFNCFVDAADEAAFAAYIATCKELTPYEIATTAAYGDRLITLATCEYTHSNGRMVVVAKRVAEAD